MKPFITTLVCGVIALASHAETLSPIGNTAVGAAEILASFEKPNSTKKWQSINDGVMGGLSKGSFKRTEQNTLLFSGDLSLKNNGGFASIRTKPDTLNLDGATGILVKARGDGRTYRVQLRTAGTGMATSYRANLSTKKGEFVETLIPFSNFQLQVFGRFFEGSQPVNPADINSIGISIADKIAGPFEFEVESIKAFRGYIEPPVAVPSDKMKPLVGNAGLMENSPGTASNPSPSPAKRAKIPEMHGPLDGVWQNTDPNTRSIPKIEITSYTDGTTEFVYWGRTHPNDSKYGPVGLTLLGSSVEDSSPNTYGYTTQDCLFADAVFFVERQGDQLVLRSLRFFKDGSGRSNYHQTLTFERAES